MRLSIKPQRELFLTLLICSLGFNTSIAQSNDDYLKSLEGEAANLTLDSQTKSKKTVPFNPAPSKTVPATPASEETTEDGKIPSGLSFDGFLNNLKNNYIGTYFFTKRLSSEQKIEIYAFYQKNNDPQAIRSQIIQISKKN